MEAQENQKYISDQKFLYKSLEQELIKKKNKELEELKNYLKSDYDFALKVQENKISRKYEDSLNQ